MNTYMLQNLLILDEIIQMAFLSIMNTVSASTSKNITFCSKIRLISCNLGLNMIQSNSIEMLIHLSIIKGQRPHLNVKEQKKDLFSEFIFNLLHAYARWKGTGEPCSNFSWKSLKNFSRRIWKIFSGFIHLRSLYRNILLIWLDTQRERF